MIGKAKSKYIISVCTRKLGSKLDQTLNVSDISTWKKGHFLTMGRK
jgi:hypothetical protein